MKLARVLKSALSVSICMLGLVAVVGCSSGAASSSSVAPSSSAASSSAADAQSSAASASSASSSASSSSSSASSGSAQLTAESAAAQGYQVFEGTVRVVDAEELIALQAIDIDPAAAGGGGTYAVLVFDRATDVVGQGADGSGERTESANMLGIAEYTKYSSFVEEYGDLDACEAFDGQHVTLIAKAKDIWFPSDVSLPIGEPKAESSLILS